VSESSSRVYRGESIDTLQGKVALVTGAASGIGRAIAERLAAEGARVVVADVQQEAGEVIAGELGGLYVKADISRGEACRYLVERTVDAYGTVHILVNNAGFQHIDPIEEFPEDIWDEMMAVMLTAPFLLTRHSWPFMRKQKWGRVINISSVAGLRAHPYKSAYVAVKHGLLGLTRTTALEGGPHGITVHAICPTWVRTPLMENQIADQARTRGLDEREVVEKVMVGQTAIGRVLTPAEVAAVVSFLCSDESSGMTGSPVLVDGGAVAS
jgi:3-hydroxybutyrate dehydrogenase